MTPFAEHHAAISVRDLDRTRRFYGSFGFRPVHTWRAADGSLTIDHLRLPTGYLLEVFCYAANAGAPEAELPVGNDLASVGVKHLALRVADLASAHLAVSGAGLGVSTPIQRGRTGIDYFFVRDPDGCWLEIVQDDRTLDPRHPTERSGE